MSKTVSHGRFWWRELYTSNLAEAKKFYSEVLGWDINDHNTFAKRVEECAKILKKWYADNITNVDVIKAIEAASHFSLALPLEELEKAIAGKCQQETNDDSLLSFLQEIVDVGVSVNSTLFEKNNPLETYNGLGFGVGQPYTLITDKEGSIGGMVFQDYPSQWINYILVENIEETLKKVEKHGGKIELPASKRADGIMAVVVDPSGARFALWESVNS